MRGRKPIKAVMAEYIYLLEEPILSLIGGNFVNLYWRNLTFFELFQVQSLSNSNKS
jgi:hypothetical protein